MKSFLCACFVTLLVVAGCGSSGKVSYNYQFTNNGCDTGEQVFTSLAAMCTALQSDAVNGSCALAARQAFFMTEKCPGTFLQSP
jgi:hypothetical protein